MSSFAPTLASVDTVLRDVAASRADRDPFDDLRVLADEVHRLRSALAATTGRVGQSQASLIDQLRELVGIANREGLYDAADYLARATI